jgi:hypothetical protein
MYRVSQKWIVEGESITISGNGRFDTFIGEHSTFDPTADDALLQVGDDTTSNLTSAVTVDSIAAKPGVEPHPRRIDAT